MITKTIVYRLLKEEEVTVIGVNNNKPISITGPVVNSETVWWHAFKTPLLQNVIEATVAVNSIPVDIFKKMNIVAFLSGLMSFNNMCLLWAESQNDLDESDFNQVPLPPCTMRREDVDTDPDFEIDLVCSGLDGPDCSLFHPGADFCIHSRRPR